MPVYRRVGADVGHTYVFEQMYSRGFSFADISHVFGLILRVHFVGKVLRFPVGPSSVDVASNPKE